MKFSAPLTAGTANIFEDSSFVRGQATRFKKALAEKIVAAIARQNMAIGDAARKAGCTQADIKRIKRGEVSNYSLQELVDLARHFGVKVSITIDSPQTSRPSLN